jgi:hypothetical protein
VLPVALCIIGSVVGIGGFIGVGVSVLIAVYPTTKPDQKIAARKYLDRRYLPAMLLGVTLIGIGVLLGA